LPAEHSLFLLKRSPLKLDWRATAKQITTEPMKRASLKTPFKSPSELRLDVSASGVIDTKTP
jgi:hypothetical protein